MSFDLVVWYEPFPVTVEDARRKLDVAYSGDETGFRPYPGLRRFRAALLARYPALEDLDLDVDSGVWSVTPNDSDRYISLCMSYSAPDDLITTILDLAATNNLICLDPQDNSVVLPPSLGRSLRLTSSVGRTAADPEPDVIEHCVRKALGRGGYAVLESEAQVYVQTAPGTELAYAVEYRAGSPEAHFRYETDDLDIILAVFGDFARDDGSYRERLAWQRYS